MDSISPAPVCLFVYKRLDTLKNTIASLQQNELANDTALHIFSDAAASQKDIDKVNAVREFAYNVQGFKTVAVYLSKKNTGLAQSIINGVTKVIGVAGKVIVLEDDLIVSTNFLQFMNGALMAYQDNQKIFAVSGYSSPIKAGGGTDVYFTKRSSSWGWATWQSRWQSIDWSVADFNQFISNSEAQKDFNKMGSDLTHMLKKQMDGKINSWAIRWVYHQFKYDLYTVFPTVSKVSNNGFNADGTNTYKSNEGRFATTLDISGKAGFNFSSEAFLDKHIIQQFVHPYTIQTRALYKVKALLHL